MKQLSPRERDVLQMVWDGLTSKQIAMALGVSLNRIEHMRACAGLKLKARNNVLLVRRALEKGLIQV
jgi:DNA-binding NarL/FixJ family response regulator